MIHIRLKNQKEVELEPGASGLHLAQKLHKNAPWESLGILINGELKDLSTPLSNGDEVELLDFTSPQGKEMFWHTSAHVLAQAILRLFPSAKPTIGPPIENGFYYDFADLTLSDEDFDKIESEVQTIVASGFTTHREVFPDKKTALETFKDNPFKQELIQGFEGTLTGYRQGEFFDLCRGPHIPNVGKIKAFKVLKTAGAYWRGDANNPMLTRVYAISFPDRKELKAYLEQLEEAKKRDHKVLGPRLNLFTTMEEAPGIPFILPDGMVIWNRLLEFWRKLHQKANYIEIKTPSMMARELWEVSGHWANYRDNMYSLKVEERDFAIKPMNCPGCMLVYKSKTHSYRELPLRIAEVGNVHRQEASGAISGLMRARSFHQDDAHIFMQPSQIESEILGVLNLVDVIYSTFGLSYHLELSTRPEKNTIGSDQDWEVATNGLQNALDKFGKPYKINPGDGAFYGPKIDLHIRDAIGRTWQCGTIQLDMSLPERFNLEYTDHDGNRPRPIMIHRALFGSIERFFGILIEHFAGKFPLWLSPQQIRLLPVADRHNELAQKLAQRFQEEGFIAHVDSSHESIGKKVRNAQMEYVNYMLTLGDKELEDQSISVRTRDGTIIQGVSVDAFLEKIKEERSSFSLSSSFSNAQETKN